MLLRTRLELKDDIHVVEIPKAIVALYSLKPGMPFHIKAIENKHGVCIINLAVEIPNNQ